MQANEVVKEILKEKNINQGELTELLGMKYQSGVSQALNRDMKISMLSRFAEVLKCEVVFRDIESKKEWVIGQTMAQPVSTQSDSEPILADNRQSDTNESSPMDLDTLLITENTKTNKRIKLK
ncbi:MAG: helix-turn-helix domain-containing protein [Anaerorhabdus sp.]|uniref:helix-turn-helix domain-containing protein n=1 Tax=Anaerorhabdus sp. TaxID=1872524 RepID=UPI003A8792FE